MLKARKNNSDITEHGVNGTIFEWDKLVKV